MLQCWCGTSDFCQGRCCKRWHSDYQVVLALACRVTFWLQLVSLAYVEREKERERERKRERERDRQRQTETDRDRQRQTEKEREKREERGERVILHIYICEFYWRTISGYSSITSNDCGRLDSVCFGHSEGRLFDDKASMWRTGKWSPNLLRELLPTSFSNKLKCFEGIVCC